MDIDAKDCRIEGTTEDAQAVFWLRATHLPTGVVVESDTPGGEMNKRVLMEKLQREVCRHSDQRRDLLVAIRGAMNKPPKADDYLDQLLEEVLARIEELQAALAPFAKIALWKDAYPDSNIDSIDAPDLWITPDQIRTARQALG